MPFWRLVDWQAPWLAPYRKHGEEAIRRLGQGMSVAAALDAAEPPAWPKLANGPLRFVDAAERPRGEAYEAFISRTARVPTRDNLHDLFNGLVWLAFPALKRHLNELHARPIARDGIGCTRGPVRDALTLFDENAALWQAPPALVEALRERDWQRLFIAERPAWRAAGTVLFGHALLEKLCRPRPAITAHAWPVPLGVDVETFMVGALTAQRLAARSHLPLPVLGVPGWWPGNQSASFYLDASVFRA
jgi:hypothetical protein